MNLKKYIQSWSVMKKYSVWAVQRILIKFLREFTIIKKVMLLEGYFVFNKAKWVING